MTIVLISLLVSFLRHYYKRGILERVEGRRLVYKFSMGTLERLQQKKLQLVEMAANRMSYGSRDKNMSNGQYNLAAPLKDPNCGQYGMVNTNIPGQNNTQIGHSQYGDYDQGRTSGQYALSNQVNKHDAETGNVTVGKPLDGSTYGTASQNKVMDNSAYMLPNHQRDYTYSTLE